MRPPLLGSTTNYTQNRAKVLLFSAFSKYKIDAILPTLYAYYVKRLGKSARAGTGSTFFYSPNFSHRFLALGCVCAMFKSN